MKIPKDLESRIDHYTNRYKTFQANTRNWNARFELFKRYYEGYQYEDDNLGEGKTQIKDVMERQRVRDSRGPSENAWKFRINDNIMQEIVDYFLVDYVVTDPSFDMDPINDDTQSVQIAKSMDRVIKHVKEYNNFMVTVLEASLLCVLTGTVYYLVFEDNTDPENKQVGIDYLPYDKIIDDGEATDLEKSEFIIRVHDLPLYKFEEQFRAMYKQIYGDRDPYESEGAIETSSILGSLEELYKLFDGVKQYVKKQALKKVRVLEILNQDDQQIFLVETGEMQFEYIGAFANPYPMRYPVVKNRFKVSPLASGGSTFTADMIEVQNAINFITSAAVNNAVEQSNAKRFMAEDVFIQDQDGESKIIGPKSQTFRYTPSLVNQGPLVFYDQPPVLSPQLYNAKQDLIDRTYKRLNITPATRGLLPASRTSQKALEYLVGQRNNQSQSYMILYKTCLQNLMKKVLQMARVVYSEDDLIKIVGQDSMYAVEKFREYIPANPILRIVAGTEVDSNSGEKQALVLQLLQYGGPEVFDNDALMRVVGLSRDEAFRPPAEADRNLAIMQIAQVLSGEKIPAPEKGQNHLVFIEEINKLKKTKSWLDASDKIKVEIDMMQDAHYKAQQQEMYELQLIDAEAKKQAQDIAAQMGIGGEAQPPQPQTPAPTTPEAPPAPQAPVQAPPSAPQPGVNGAAQDLINQIQAQGQQQNVNG